MTVEFASGSWLLALRARIVSRLPAQTFFQRLLQGDGPAMLLQEIGEGFLGQLLQRLHAVAREQSQRVPRLRVELDALAYYAIADLSLSTRSVFSHEKPPSLSGSRPKCP
jgi:hypothetical protein